MDFREYISSERFIHGDLLARATAVVHKLPDQWNRDGRIATVLLSWPGEPVKGDDGSVIDDVCVADLSEVGPEEQDQARRTVAARTKAYGLFFVEQAADEVRASFETRHGSCVWTFPIRRHGDVVVLEQANVVADGMGLGILWIPR